MAEQPENKPIEQPNEKPNGDGAGAVDTPLKPEETPKFTQAQLDAIVKDRLDRERKAADTKAQKDREALEADRLKEQGEFQKLAEQRQQRITELEATAADIDTAKAEAGKYKAALTAHLETQRKDLPAHIIKLLDRMDPVEQLEYIAENREALGAKTGTNGAAIPGSGRADTGAGLTEAERERRRALVAQQVRRAL